MCKPQTKNVLSFLFLAAFLLLRVGNVHAATHISEDSEATHCELCELIQVNNESMDVLDLSFTEVPTIVEIPVVKSDLKSTYLNVTLPFVFTDLHLNRPPPVH